jgi:hypothetical protein
MLRTTLAGVICGLLLVPSFLCQPVGPLEHLAVQARGLLPDLRKSLNYKKGNMKSRKYMPVS